MKTEAFTVCSRQDGLPLEVLLTLPEPEEKLRGLVQISHGMCEHKERYLPFMDYLARHGYGAVIHDHRGHGQNAKEADSLGFFGDETGDAIAADLYQVTEGIRQRFPDTPIWLFGHSMGSLVARKYLKTHDDQIRGLVLSGAPWNNPGAHAGLALARGMAKVKGGRYRSRFIHDLADGAFGRAFPDNGWLSANEENVKAFNAHPLDGFSFTLNGYMNLFRLVLDVYDDKGWQMKNPSLPVFFVAGEEDPVIGSRRKWIAEQDFMRNLGYQNTSGTLYPGMRHEILLERESERVMDDILAFLEMPR
ncbi:alpha/beta fold hydrolase [uncultured Faecalibaculum sp.]|uniref:alpha/beta fold hydrolase n=1 Tax=uncultured Faecalibaculum sp. TaxID=1729681 RepID=UPI0025F4AEB1|nr:alpha/beta fold hydrolase [uncultured Faecalibaculum sp.]